ncbi:hypothetical protein BR63_12205 [Thermanaerosceptrum fracticalcis]|uniref:UDP-N-acetylglucosamine 2-epimerase domain-containing protein n=1 Tax=Thermanaerosceptrum fracticalcis TaxID=1712410 RepID=A0A7G6E4J9_THEFR|nr:hypothetical protein [Thermanaerosceptrum fracticalcis]QNB47003.1 hypothetical protein BR63_12205 [Thermanaerosceptrum fracticalcis]
MERLDPDVSFALLQLPGNMDHGEDESEFAECMRDWKIPFITLPLVRVSNHKKNVLSKASALYGAIRNLFILNHFIRRNNPKVIVVISDVGNLNTRLLLGLSLGYGKKVLILYNTDVNVTGEKVLQNYWRRNTLIRVFSRFKIAVFLRALLFRGEVPGTFVLGEPICVISEEVKTKLVQTGIPPELIQVMGLPQSVRTERRITDLKRDLGIAAGTKTVAFFTECIDYIYGREYSRELLKILVQTFSTLPPDVVIMIKFHPREDIDFIEEAKALFQESRYRIIDSFNVEEVLAVADLSLAHFSRVLITAALGGRRFLSINWLGERQRTFVLPHESSIIEVTQPAELHGKLCLALTNGQYQASLDRVVKGIAQRYSTTGESPQAILARLLNK